MLHQRSQKSALFFHKKMILILLLAFFPLMTGFAFASEEETLPAPVQKAVYEAGQAMEAKKYGEAEKILVQYGREHVDAPHYLVEFFLGNALALQSRHAEAVRHYTACTALKADYAPAWQNLGKSAHDQGDHGRAGSALVRAYELTGKKNPDLLFQAAGCFILGKDEKKALPHLEHLASGAAGKPKPEWQEVLIKICMDLGQEKKAAQAVQGLLSTSENDPKWWKLLAQIQTRMSDYKNALVAWEVYTSLAAPTPEELVLMGELYAAIGVPAKAAQSYEKALPHKNCATLREKLANAHLAAHQPSEAVEVAEAAVKTQPTAGLWQVLGRALFELGDYGKASNAFEQSTRLNPKDGRAHLMRGYCALRLRDKGMALASLEQARKFPASRSQAEQLLRAATNL